VVSVAVSSTHQILPLATLYGPERDERGEWHGEGRGQEECHSCANAQFLGPLTAVTGPADHSTSVGRRGDDLCLSCPPAEQEISPSDPCMIVGRAVRSGPQRRCDPSRGIRCPHRLTGGGDQSSATTCSHRASITICQVTDLLSCTIGPMVAVVWPGKFGDMRTLWAAAAF
jgi:hypothetical protein